MTNRLFRRILPVFILATTACGTIATPAWKSAAVPSPTPPPTSIDPGEAQVGHWQWTRFHSPAESHPPVQMWFDIDDSGGVNGVLSIYPDDPSIPESARTLIQQNGCNVSIEALESAEFSVSFYSSTDAHVRVSVSECAVKFYGPVALAEPLNGEFAVAHDEALTQALLHPAEVELTPIERGRRVFAQYCSACHGAYAEGAPGIPALNTDQVRRYSDEQLMNIIRNGVSSTIMPAWGSVLSAEDLQGVFELVRQIEVLESGG
jgi:mono/diheme cytochrome c family protein